MGIYCYSYVFHKFRNRQKTHSPATLMAEMNLLKESTLVLCNQLQMPNTQCKW